MSVPDYFQPNTIYCGDCKEVLSKFPDNSVDLIYADPPFFSNRHYEVIWGMAMSLEPLRIGGRAKLSITLVDVQTVSVTIAAASVVAFVINSIMTSRKTEKTQELALKSQQQTLETRQAQLFMGIYDKFSSPELEKILFFMNLGNVSYNEFWKKVIENPGNKFSSTLTFYEGVGTLVKEGLLDIRLVALAIGGWTMKYWEVIMPHIDRLRKDLKYPRLASETEYLCKRLSEYMMEHSEEFKN